MKIKQGIRYGILCGIMLTSSLSQTSCSENKDDLEIEISTSGCHRSCPILDVKILDKKVVFNLIKFNNKEGLYEYELTETEKENLQDLFDVIELENLKDEYTSNRVDMQAYSVYLSKNAQEQKVYYYENEAPSNLEELVRKVIQLKNKNLVETTVNFDSKTREKVPLLDIPIPPIPDDN